MNRYSRPDYLAHHGIKGQKWGVRNGPPYPLLETQRSRKEKDLNQSNVIHLKNGDTVIKKGSTVHRITLYDESTKTGHSYITYLDGDSERYKGFFGARLKGGPIKVFKKVYQVDFKTKTDLKSPSKETRIKTFNDLYSKDKKFREALDNYAKKSRYSKRDSYIDLQRASDMKEAYGMFTRAIGGNEYIRKRYFNALKRQGYNFVNDDLDTALNLARAPAIVFDTKKSLEYKGQKKISTYDVFKTFAKEGYRLKD